MPHPARSTIAPVPEAIPYTGHKIITVVIQPTTYSATRSIVCASEFALAPAGYINYPAASPTT